jgi:hypothetical protein
MYIELEKIARRLDGETGVTVDQVRTLVTYVKSKFAYV